MFFQDPEQKIEQDIKKNHQAVQELMIHIDSLDREIKALLSELKITPEQLSHFVNREENFTPENWEQLNTQRKLLDEKLKSELQHVRDPRKVKKAQEDRNVQRHWLFVK
jgi:hypothetical protein